MAPRIRIRKKHLRIRNIVVDTDSRATLLRKVTIIRYRLLQLNYSGGGFRGGGRGRGRGGGPNMGRDRELIGQTIKITQGPYKGHIGIVKVGHAPRRWLLAKCTYI